MKDDEERDGGKSIVLEGVSKADAKMCVRRYDKGKGEKDMTNLTNHVEEICANGRFHSEEENMFGSFSGSQDSSIKRYIVRYNVRYFVRYNDRYIVRYIL